ICKGISAPNYLQIKLYETGGTNSSRIEFIYRDQNPVCINSGYSYQIGLRGLSASDFLTRANTSYLTPTSSTNGGAATTTNTFSSSRYINGAVGIRFDPNILTPAISPTPTATNTCPAATVTLTGSTFAPASPSYQWYLNNAAISGATNPTYAAATSGSYVVVASNAGCGRVSTATVVTIVSCCATPGLWTGTLSTDWHTAGNWCGSIIPTATTDVTVNSGTPFQPEITLSATCHHLTINSAATVSLLSGSLDLKGDIILNSGSFVGSGGLLNLTGTSVQTIPSILTYDLTVNNSGGITFTGDISVLGTLTLTAGIVATGSNKIVVINFSVNSVTGFSSTSYINGKLQRYISNGIINFPVGTATNYELITISNNGLAPTVTLLAEFVSSNTGCTTVPNGGGGPYVNGSQINNLLNGGFWTVTPDVQPTSGDYDVTLNEKGYSNTPPGPTYCAVIKRDDYLNLWHSLGVHSNATQSIAGGTVTAKRSTLTSFSDFGVGFSGSVLPIELLSFTASKYNNAIDALLEWTTASELNNDHFELEVATVIDQNGDFDFKKIGQVAGHGTSEIAHSYSFID
ncbi:MAG: hypothetical protein WCI97_12660, partial [Bacteroidota bacterium]